MSYIVKKQAEIGKQILALDCDRFRITLKPRRERLKPVNYGNLPAAARDRMGKKERFWTGKEMVSEKMIKALTTENMRGYDIYVTPISNAYHYFVIDDMTPEKLDAALNAGYSPALIQLSSKNNMQGILIVPKLLSAGEQSVANALVVGINLRFGDAKLCGVVHPFRLAGFFNKKLGKNDAETKVLVANFHVCHKADAELAAIRQAQPCPAPASSSRGGAAGVSLLGVDVDVDSVALAAFLQFRADVVRLSMSKGWEQDESRIDFATAKRMHVVGFSNQQIVGAILSGSPNISLRHSNPAHYASRTVHSVIR